MEKIMAKGKKPNPFAKGKDKGDMKGKCPHCGKDYSKCSCKKK
jgi:hypothetical protein